MSDGIEATCRGQRFRINLPGLLMSLAVGQVCYDSRRGRALTFPALVGRETVVWDVLTIYGPKELRQELVRQGGLVVAGLRGASVA
eukprot:7169587-Pyramimonas_sp.AAC.1